MEQLPHIKPDTTAEELAELIKTGNANVCKRMSEKYQIMPIFLTLDES